jgi:hypothetical protein
VIVGVSVRLVGLAKECNESLAGVWLSAKLVGKELQGGSFLRPAAAELEELPDEWLLIHVGAQPITDCRQGLVGSVGPFAHLCHHSKVPRVIGFTLAALLDGNERLVTLLAVGQYQCPLSECPGVTIAFFEHAENDSIGIRLDVA